MIFSAKSASKKQVIRHITCFLFFLLTKNLYLKTAMHLKECIFLSEQTTKSQIILADIKIFCAVMDEKCLFQAIYP